MTLPFPERPVPTPSLEMQKMIVDASHENGMLAVAHALTNHSTLHVLRAGVDGLAHASIEPINEEIIQAFKKNNAFVIPTLVIHASSSGEEQETRDRFASGLQGPERNICLDVSTSHQKSSLSSLCMSRCLLSRKRELTFSGEIIVKRTFSYPC